MPKGSRTPPTAPDADAGVTVGTANVFADIGLPYPELHLAKARVVAHISAAIAADKLTPATAAKRLGVPPEKLRALVRGRFTGYSLDRLVRLLGRLGRTVDIAVSDPFLVSG